MRSFYWTPACAGVTPVADGRGRTVIWTPVYAGVTGPGLFKISPNSNNSIFENHANHEA